MQSVSKPLWPSLETSWATTKFYALPVCVRRKQNEKARQRFCRAFFTQEFVGQF